MPKFDNKPFVKSYSALTGVGVEQYLNRFDIEHDYESRVKNSFYVNNIKSIVESLSTPVLASPIERESTNILYNAFIEDVDHAGTHIEDALQELLNYYIVDGNAFLVFNNVSEFSGGSLQEQVDLKEYPTMNVVPMAKLYDIDINNGTIEYVEFYNGTTEDGSNIILGYNSTEIYSYVEGKRDKTIESNPHEFGITPVLSLTGNIPNLPNLKDLIDTNLAIYNQLSEQRDLERAQAFALLEIPNDAPEDGTVELDKDNIIWVPTTSSRGSTYVSPDPNILKVLLESAEAVSAILKEQASKMGSLAVKESTQSGVAYAYEFVGASYALSKYATFLERVEYKIVEMLETITNLSISARILYTKEFNPTTTELQGLITTVKDSTGIGIEYTQEELQPIKDAVLRIMP